MLGVRQSGAAVREGLGGSMTEAGRMPEWRQYWTPEEYADLQEVMTSQELEEEIVRMRAKTEHYRVAEAFGFSIEAAVLIRASSIMITAEEEDVA